MNKLIKDARYCTGDTNYGHTKTERLIKADKKSHFILNGNDGDDIGDVETRHALSLQQ